MLLFTFIACSPEAPPLQIQQGSATLSGHRVDLANQDDLRELIVDLTGPVKRRRVERITIDANTEAEDVARVLRWLFYAADTPVQVGGVTFVADGPQPVDACDLDVVYVRGSHRWFSRITGAEHGHVQIGSIDSFLRRAPPTCEPVAPNPSTCDRALLVASGSTVWSDLSSPSGRFALVAVRDTALTDLACPGGD